MKSLIPFFIFLYFLNVKSSAQTIEGLLVDSLTQEPLAFATVKMESKAQSKPLEAEIANDKGTFKFVGVKKDKYLIKVEYIGYKSKIIEVEFDIISENLNMGAISLSPLSQLLESMVVNGLKRQVISNLEKQVFKAEQFEVAKGGTATDVLKNIPSVMINAEGEIIVRGAKGFLILINGKPSQIDAAILLAQIPANTIEKIEMITAPSAKYDADGKAGIINIITKTGTTNGLNATINNQYGLPRLKSYYNENDPLRYGIDGTVTFKKDKWDNALSINYLKNDIAGRREGDVNTSNGSVRTDFPSVGERSFRRENYGVRAISSYKFSSKDELSGGLYFGIKEQYRTANIYYDNTKTDLRTNETLQKYQYYNSNLVLKSGKFYVYNLDYLHSFGQKSSIAISGLYEYALLDGFTKNRNLHQLNFSDTLQYTLNTGSNPLHALRLKADYEQGFSTGKLSFGYQYRTQNQKGNFVFEEKIGNFTTLVINPDFTANIDVNNIIHGLYTQYVGTYKKLEFATGLRYENAFRKFNAENSSEDVQLKLSNLFPSANLLYNLKSDLRLKLAYSRRVQRSTNNELNPYPEREHSETLEQGDPHIKPEFIGLYEAGVTKDFKKTSFFWNVYSQQITDIVNRVNSVYNDTILNRIFTNAGKAQLYGTESNITYSPFKKLKLYIGANLYSLKINGTLFDNSVKVNTKGWVYSINTNFTYQITKTLNTQFNLSYMSARNTAQGQDSRFYQPNFTLKKTLDKFTLSLLWQNASFGKMNVNQQRITTFGNNFFTTTNYIQEVNIFMFNLSYNFRQNQKKVKLPSSEFGEKEF
jgi:outer membrane receptor protein involved in Fe transport